MKLQAKVFVQDEDCHWYLIPVEEREDFDKANEEGNHDYINEYFWKQYRCEYPKWLPVYLKCEVDNYKEKLFHLLEELDVGVDIDTLELLY